MRLRIHHALFSGFIGITGFLLVLLGALVGTGLREELREAFEDELSRQLNLAAEVLEQTDPEALGGVVLAVSQRIEHRVSVISLEGELIADSDVPGDMLSEAENHGTRPEVVGALAGALTFAERTSSTVNDPFLYGAQLVTVAGRPAILRIAAPLTRVETAVTRIRGRVILTAVLVMSLALGVAWLLSLALARPLASMATQARQLAAGNLDLRVTTGRRVTEMENLARAFNRLGSELQERIVELAGERDGIQDVIDALDEGVLSLDAEGRVVRWNRALVELLSLPRDMAPGTPVASLIRAPELRSFMLDAAAGARGTREIHMGDLDLVATSGPLGGGGGVVGILNVSEIRRLERVRRDFVANASHELKTPLTSIRGFAETLVESEPEPELRRVFLTSILNNTVRLQNMVDDLLDLSRLESGGWVASNQPVEVQDVARAAFEPLKEMAESQDKTFEISGLGWAAADPAGLTQVLRNLYENALRHTDPGGQVSVRIREELEVVHVAVQDDGEGIPIKSLPRIFERFYRADSSRARDQGGTGLGLAIVRHLVNSMQGTVWAESELGSGTTVNFTLPKAPRPAATANVT